MEPGIEIFFDQLDFVKSFCYLGGRFITSGGSEAAVTARTRTGWIKFRECGKQPYGRKVFIKNEMKDVSELYKICNAIWE